MEKVTVTVDRKVFEEMQKELYILYSLEAAGVYNWEGYEEALKILEIQGITFD